MAATRPRPWLIAVAVVAVLAYVAAAFAVGSFVAAPRFFLLGPGLVFLLVALNFGAIVAAVVSALTRDDLTSAQRIIWILVAVFVVPVLAVGAIVYFALGRERTRELFRDLSPAPQPPQQQGPPAPPPPDSPPR